MALRAALSRTNYGASDAQPLLLKVDFATDADSGAAQQRPPLNIALVLDRSGSMAEDGKLDYTLAAAGQVIENLTDRDMGSFVAFNHEVIVLSPAGEVVNKPFLLHRLEEVSASGWTDISAGLLEGIAQVRSRAAPGQVKHVLLLTDGLANRGVTGRDSLQTIAQKARADGIGLSTMGVGAEFDETLLAGLAAAGEGRYTYVRSPEQIPTAFAEELQGLLHVAAQNARLRISVEGGRIARVYGGLPPVVAEPGAYELSLDNLRSGDSGVLLFELTPSDLAQGGALKVTAQLTYDDTAAGQRFVRAAEASAAFAAQSREGPQDEGVMLWARVLDAADTAEAAVAGFDAERARQASDAFAQVYERARAYALEARDQQLLNHVYLLKHFMSELDAVRNSGLLHQHDEARQKLQKEIDFNRYLRTHHRQPPSEGSP